MEEYITIEKFAKIYDISVNTVKRRYKDIPGVNKDNNWLVLKGTRYPYNIRRAKLKSSSEKRYVLLKAISEERYINGEMLKTSEETLRLFLDDFEQHGYIKKNDCSWLSGVNQYICTIEGDELLNKKKKEVLLLLSEMTGRFMGAAFNNYMN